MTDIISAIIAINPDAQVSVNGEDYEQITWNNGTAVISKSDIVAKQAELKTAFDALNYSRNRAKAYPSIEDQMDMLWHSIDNDAELKSKYFDFHQAILAVKAKHPK